MNSLKFKISQLWKPTPRIEITIKHTNEVNSIQSLFSMFALPALKHVYFFKNPFKLGILMEQNALGRNMWSCPQNSNLVNFSISEGKQYYPAQTKGGSISHQMQKGHLVVWTMLIPVIATIYWSDFRTTKAPLGVSQAPLGVSQWPEGSAISSDPYYYHNIGSVFV